MHECDNVTRLAIMTAFPPKQGLVLKSRAQGFTMLELLVVLAIMALLVSIVPPAMGKLSDAVAYRQTLQDVTGMLRKARQQAVLGGAPVSFVLDTASREYGLAGQGSARLPDSLQMKAITAEGVSSQGQAIVFLPEGGATGGSIVLTRSAGGGIRLRVDWLSGLVSKEPL